MSHGTSLKRFSNVFQVSNNYGFITLSKIPRPIRDLVLIWFWYERFALDCLIVMLHTVAEQVYKVTCARLVYAMLNTATHVNALPEII